MLDNNKLSEMEELLGQINNQMPKRIKNERGLIEKTQKSRIILTEDNKQLLVD